MDEQSSGTTNKVVVLRSGFGYGSTALCDTMGKIS